MTPQSLMPARRLDLAPFDLARDADPALAAAANRMAALYRERELARGLKSDFDSRFYKALSFLLPFLAANLPRRPRHVLEIGCGKGAKSMPLSLLADSYHGLDIVPAEIAHAREAAARLEAANATFFVDEAANLEAFLGRAPVKYDLVILYAVVEHLTPPEKLAMLRTIWDYLDEDGFLLIGEAPNRMHGVDYHSTKSLYFQQMPFELWEPYLERVPNAHWRGIIGRAIREGSWPKTAWRHGVHVGHQEFDLALMPVEALAEHIVADSFDVNLLNLYPFEFFEFLRLAELRSFRAFPSGVQIEPRAFPDLFARYYIEVLLSKRRRLARRPVAAEMPAIDGSRALFAPDAGARALTVRHGAPWRHALAGGGPASGEVALTLALHEPMQAGRIAVRDARGAPVADIDPPAIARRFATWRRNLAVGLPAIAPGRYPLSLEPSEPGGAFRLAAVFEQAARDGDDPRRTAGVAGAGKR
jgi:SAM-dependent methyltransferase